MPPKRTKNQLRREKAKLRKLEEKAVSDSKPIKGEDVHTEYTSHDEKLPPQAADAKKAIQEPEQDTKKRPIEDSEDNKNSHKLQKCHDEIDKDDKANTVQKTPKNKTGESSINALEIPEELLQQYSSVLKKFNAEETEQNQIVENGEVSQDSSGSDVSDFEENEEKPLSRRQLRKRNRVSIAQLKAFTDKPEAVSWYDEDAPDPYLFVFLKTGLNTIDVPGHWLQKKEYLSSKRGIERLPYKLPKFIEETGIAEMRNYDPESLKKSQRERVQPKMGKLDIDYQKLHDAFFKYQTKPRLLGFGDLYYEGREKSDHYKDQISRVRPGVISKRLRAAIGLPENDQTIVPPWIRLMSLIGKPPAYADCIIPGVDTDYKNTGYKLGDTDGVDLSSFHAPYWGQVEEGEESAYELLDDEEEEDEQTQAEEESVPKDEDTAEIKNLEQEPEKVELLEYTRHQTTQRVNDGVSQSNEPLYKVLKEKSTGGNGTTYEIAQKKGEERSNDVSEPAPKKEDDDIENFKF